jgi:hypothetical protein
MSDDENAHYKYTDLICKIGFKLEDEVRQIDKRLQGIYGCLWVLCGCAILATLKYVSG